MDKSMRVGEHDYPLSHRAAEWKDIIDEATVLVFDFIALFEKARDLYTRAANKAGMGMEPMPDLLPEENATQRMAGESPAPEPPR